MSRTAPETLPGLFTRAVREHLDRLREGEARVRADGDLEGVHLMRTSCRRLRATVRFLGDHLRKSERRRLQAGLRDFMTALGDVRDLDVLRQAVEGVPALDPADGEGLRETVEERLARATERMAVCLDGPAYADLRAGLEQALQVPGGDVPAELAGPGRITAALEDVLRLRPAVFASAPEESLHDLRKGVKRLRYALEAFQPAYGKPVTRAIARLRGLQEALGLIQDAAAFEERLRGIRTFAAGQFLATARTRARTEVGGLDDAWKEAFGPKALGRLGSHLFRRGARRPSAPDEAGEGMREAG